MDEKMDELFPEENPVREPEITENEVEITVEEPLLMEVAEADAEEEIPAAQETAEEEVSASLYRGAGSGRKESPFADSPYVVRCSEPAQEPDTREAEAPRKKDGAAPRKKHIGKRILAAVAALALVAGSCAVTAGVVTSRWEARADRMEEAFQEQIRQLQGQLDAMTPDITGESVSGTAGQGGLTAGQVYARNVNSVVLIESTIVSSVYGQTATGVASGSGFVLSEDGYVLTNFHVIEGASSVAVVLCDGSRYEAAVVGYDSINDIAVLKVDAVGLDAVKLGSSSDLIVGDQVVAIGNPLGELTSTLTVGYVSAKERTVSTDGSIINMIQTDAAINSGNSGGPLFNMRGEVVGITTAKYSGASSSGATIEGIGFAIPIDDVLEEIGELRQFGYIKSAYLGVMVQNMDASVSSIYGLPVGAYVVGVEEGFCAERAGVQVKDIITAVGDVPVETIADLTRALRDYEPGDRASLTIYRAGQILTLSVVLDERPAGLD